MKTWKDFEKNVLMFIVLGFLFFSLLLVVLYVIPASNDYSNEEKGYQFFKFVIEGKNSTINNTIDQTVMRMI